MRIIFCIVTSEGPAVSLDGERLLKAHGWKWCSHGAASSGEGAAMFYAVCDLLGTH